MSRDEHGPEFDDRLIKLVKENAAIYDVSHPHYRRTPVRMAIWDNIARELGAPSRFLQTKWKNIRYNYLQEQKCLETGTFNTNIRKRRFTEDLSFLKYTAYRRDASVSGGNVKMTNNGSDNDSNSFMYPDNLAAAASSTYEVIELDQSDDEEANNEYMPDVSAFLAPMNDITETSNSPQDPYAQPDNLEETEMTEEAMKTNESMPNSPTTTTNGGVAKLEPRTPNRTAQQILQSPKSETPDSPHSNRSSPLLTIMDARNQNGGFISNGDDPIKLTNGNSTSTYSELTIQPLTACFPKKRLSNNTPPEQIMLNAAKRKATPTLQPINDPIELYCLSLVDCLRAMARSERERVKYEFSKILKDAQYVDQS